MLPRSPLVSFVGDLHLGNHKKNGGPLESGLNARCRQGLVALERAVQRSIEMGAETMVILGDVFHVSDPEPQLLAAAARILRQRRLRVLIIVGNHDQESMAPGDHALGVLGLPANVEIVEDPRLVTIEGCCHLFLVPFQPGDARQWLPAACDVKVDRWIPGIHMNTPSVLPTIMCTHVGIYDSTFPRHLAEAHDAVPLELIEQLHHEQGFAVTMAGNWHSRRFWSLSHDGWTDKVLQIGALGPTGFGNPGMDGYGTLAFWSLREGISWEEIPGPRFAVISGAERATEVMNAVERATQSGCQVYVSVRTPVANLARAREWIAEQVRSGRCMWGEAIPDAAGAEQAAQRAAAAARSTTVLQDAVHSYAQKMEIPDGIPREEVISVAMDFLKGATGGVGGGSLQVQRIAAENFMQFKEVELTLPDHGIVLVTGNNGKGKSSLIEVVSMAGWGKTLRDTSPWPKQASKGYAQVISDVAHITRHMSGGRTRLDWSEGVGIAPERWESTTKGTKHLMEVIGEHDVWRRTHVFSSSDAATFANATDDKRKHLMEVILGLDVFDDAQKKCRARLKDAKATALSTSHQVELARTRLTGQEGQVEMARRSLDGLIPPEGEEALEGARGLLLKEMDGLDVTLQALRGKLEITKRAGAVLDARADAMERRLEALQQQTCPTCNQALPQPEKIEEIAASVRLEIQDIREQAARQRAAAAQEAEQIIGEGKALAAQRAALAGREAELGRQIAVMRATAAQYHRARGVIAEAEAGLTRRREEVAAREAEEAQAQRLVGLLRVVEGLNVGVRANVLGEALAGIEAVANVALARLLSSEVVLRLCVDEDKLVVEITGMGDDRGYHALSGGQRRRVDVALLLGLAQVSSAAYGRAPGSLFFDEAFDALDPQGVENLVGLLGEMAAERTIMVISHNPDLISGIPAVLRVRVTDESTLTLGKGSS